MYNETPNCFHDLQGPICSGTKPLTALKQILLRFLLLSPSVAWFQLTDPYRRSNTPQLLAPQGLCCGCAPCLEPHPHTFTFMSSLPQFLLQRRLLRKASWVHPIPKGA